MLLLAAVAAALLLSACGDDPAPSPAPQATSTPAVVAVDLDLETPAAGPPDAGTQGGHRAGAARGKTRSATFSFDGIAAPANAEITAEGAAAKVEPVGDHGDFTVKLTGLKPGSNRLTLRATADGHEPWEQDVVITRR